ncbi:MAG: SocA family protein [Ignavibacteria bacterium]|nr:SocA family protein [Ignavibacteria bacterium]
MKLNNTYRQKLLNAVIYFTKNVKNPSKVKIFKLLYFLDFRHYSETGKNVTNMDYNALEFGPVPLSFYEEVKENEVPEDFKPFICIQPFMTIYPDKKGGIFKIKTTARLDLNVFSPREQKIMKELVDIFKDVNAEMISELSHFKNQPWDKTIKEKGLNKLIDYRLALDKDSEIDLIEADNFIKERNEMLNAFRISNL